MMRSAKTWIEALELTPHPEGGHYRQTYRSAESIAADHLPSRFSGPRTFSTAIYYLLQGTEFSAFHRIHQDEIWHYHDGASLSIHVIDGKRQHRCLRLGVDPAKDVLPQRVVAAGCLFAAEVDDKNSFALVSCTVAPGFDFADWHMPARSELVQEFPEHHALVGRLAR